MKELDNDMNPMNHPDALIARFQFLKIAHGDGLDINEPSYVERINAHLSSYRVEDINNLINHEDNSYLKRNQYVIPFLFARYKVVPRDEVLELLKTIVMVYSESRNIYFQHFVRNFDDILRQKISDVPLQAEDEDDKNTSIVLYVIVSALLSLFVYFILSVVL
jgi:hypothetical protein